MIQLSLYKVLGEVEDVKSLKVTPIESYFKSLTGSTKFIYFSPTLGTLVKDLETKVTEKFDNTLGVTYLDAIEDDIGEITLLLKTNKGFSIKSFNKDLLKFETISLALNTGKGFLSKLNGNVICIYINRTDNKMYYRTSEDSFNSQTRLSDRVFDKQEIEYISSNLDLNIPSVFTVVTDNTLLLDYQKHPILENKSFIEVPIHHKLFLREV